MMSPRFSCVAAALVLIAVAQSTQNITRPLPYYEDSTGMVFEIKSAATGFSFPYAKPGLPKYYANGQVHGSISTKLGKLGLACSQNTPTKVGGYASNLVSQYQPGHFQWMTNKVPLMAGKGAVSSPQATPAFPSSTNQVDGGMGGALHDKMIMMLRDVTKLNSIYYVSHTTSSGSYSSSSLGSILETFKQAGNFIGTLQTGQQVEGAQVGNLVSSMLQSLSETTKKDWSYNKQDVLVAMMPSASGANMMAGVYYTYKASVQDFKNKKKETHKSNYAVENYSVLFSDETTFNYVFKKFTTL